MIKAKVYIEVVDNGFILRVKSYGLGILKEPYEKGIYVFTCFAHLNEFLVGTFGLNPRPTSYEDAGTT